MNEVDLPNLGKPGPASVCIVKLLGAKLPSNTLRGLYTEGYRFTAPEALEGKMVDAVSPSPMEAVISLIEERKLIGKGEPGMYGPFKGLIHADVITAMTTYLETVGQSAPQVKAKI
jgi:hypothetical protein